MSKKINFGTKPQNKNTPQAELADEWVSKGIIEVPIPEAIEVTRFTIDIPSELHRKIKSFCALKGVKMKEEIQILLETHFTE
jgi:hypothetical protein